ncbi:hypothetical protein F4780DRAFT_773877 [Xylariomycetidae sp. FL0641]|nr:hypothetical protein F4780DRAFT_773877 [Xylariomycetidae sp. FL0641]
MKCSQCVAPAPVTIDEDGDLLLEVGQFQCPHVVAEDERLRTSSGTFRVCSRTLSRCSPVMKKMLFGGFSEARRPSGQAWKIQLPEDDAKAMEVILNIIHSHFERIPTTDMSLDTLYGITVLTDKYNLTRLLRPWVQQWDYITKNDLGCGENMDRSDEGYLEKRIWLAWELGDEERLQQFARDMAQFSNVDEDGALVNETNQVYRFDGLLDPPELLDLISHTRLQMLKAILGYMDEAVNCLVKGTLGHLQCREPRRGADPCHAVLLGSAIRALCAKGMWPLPEPDSVLASPNNTLRKLKLLNVFGAKGHTTCWTRFTVEIDRVARGVPLSLREVHQRHCAEQAKKSGFVP